MKKYHEIKNVKFDRYFILFNCDDIDYKIDLRSHSKRLLENSLEVRSIFEISPSGYGIHWPIIDEDLSIDAMINNTKKITKRTLTRHRTKQKELIV